MLFTRDTRDRIGAALLLVTTLAALWLVAAAARPLPRRDPVCLLRYVDDQPVFVGGDARFCPPNTERRPQP